MYLPARPLRASVSKSPGHRSCQLRALQLTFLVESNVENKPERNLPIPASKRFRFELLHNVKFRQQERWLESGGEPMLRKIDAGLGSCPGNS